MLMGIRLNFDLEAAAAAAGGHAFQCWDMAISTGVKRVWDWAILGARGH